MRHPEDKIIRMLYVSIWNFRANSTLTDFNIKIILHFILNTVFIECYRQHTTEIFITILFLSNGIYTEMQGYFLCCQL